MLSTENGRMPGAEDSEAAAEKPDRSALPATPTSASATPGPTADSGIDKNSTAGGQPKTPNGVMHDSSRVSTSADKIGRAHV